MSNQPPPPGGPDEPTRHSGNQPPYGGQPQQPGPNPYGGQPQPGGQNPYGQPQNPQQQNPYGQPQQQNPYGQPQQGHPGQYQQPGQYPGQPGQYQQPGQGQYGQPGTYQQPGQQPGQQWQGQQYGGSGSGGGSKKKWLIPLLAIVLVGAIVGGIFLAVNLMGGDDEGGTEISDLAAGDCLTSGDIADGGDSIDDIETVDCGEEHDAEVFATFELEADDVEDFDINDQGTTCVEELESAGTSLDDLSADGNEVRPLVGSDDPAEGDEVVCFIRNSDGEKLSDQIVE